MAQCKDCHVGPGKFEGESARTAILYAMMLDGTADDGVGEDGGANLFRAPINCDTDAQWANFAIDTGFCANCVAEAVDALNSIGAGGGVLFEENAQGFVASYVFEEKGALEMAWEEAQRYYGGGEEEDEGRRAE